MKFNDAARYLLKRLSPLCPHSLMARIEPDTKCYVCLDNCVPGANVLVCNGKDGTKCRIIAHAQCFGEYLRLTRNWTENMKHALLMRESLTCPVGHYMLPSTGTGSRLALFSKPRGTMSCRKFRYTGVTSTELFSVMQLLFLAMTSIFIASVQMPWQYRLFIYFLRWLPLAFAKPTERAWLPIFLSASASSYATGSDVWQAIHLAVAGIDILLVAGETLQSFFQWSEGGWTHQLIDMAD
jgi:hypothetical protein